MNREAFGWIALAVSATVFFKPVARPLAKGARWLYERRPWGRKARTENARLVRRLNEGNFHVHTDECLPDCQMAGKGWA